MKTWLKVIKHCCGDETKFMIDWIRGLILNPEEGRPYLYFWGPEECGKSSIHYAISLLLEKGQYSHVSSLLRNPLRPNYADMFGTTLCVVEEGHGDLEQLTHYVQDTHIDLHRQGSYPYKILNRTNWIECSNVCTPPPFAKVFEVQPLEKIIPHMELMQLLKDEKDSLMDFLI